MSALIDCRKVYCRFLVVGSYDGDFIFFFFQAEDGIRDYKVTGVQTCALPILALGIASIFQTIPSLALFGFLIPIPYIGGIGKRTAAVALVLYALLPILRNTYEIGRASCRERV